MSTEASARNDNLQLVLRSSSDGANAMGLFNRFRRADYTANWLVGPVSQPQKVLKAQYLWAELKLWPLYDACKVVEQSRWASLVTFEIRLASSWYFRSDFMGVYPEYLVRKVRNEFFVKARKTEAEVQQSISLLCEFRNC